MDPVHILMDPVHGPGLRRGSMDQGSMFCTFPSKIAITNTELFCSLSFIFEIRNICRLQT